MEIILLFDKEKESEIKAILDDEEKGYFRGSYQFKDPKSLGLEEKETKQYLYFQGPEDMIKKLKDDLKDLTEKAKKESDVLQKLKDEEASANVGMGTIFG